MSVHSLFLLWIFFFSLWYLLYSLSNRFSEHQRLCARPSILCLDFVVKLFFRLGHVFDPLCPRFLNPKGLLLSLNGVVKSVYINFKTIIYFWKARGEEGESFTTGLFRTGFRLVQSSPMPGSSQRRLIMVDKGLCPIFCFLDSQDGLCIIKILISPWLIIRSLLTSPILDCTYALNKDTLMWDWYPRIWKEWTSIPFSFVKY